KELVRMSVAPSTAAFTPDGRTLIVACWKEGVRLCQASTGKEIRRLGSEKTGFSQLAVSPDGTMLAVVGEGLSNDGLGSSDQTVWRWDLASGKELRRLPVGRSSIRALAFSPNGRLLASAGSEQSGRTTWSGVVRLWETATGKELRRLEKHDG